MQGEKSASCVSVMIDEKKMYKISGLTLIIVKQTFIFGMV